MLKLKNKKVKKCLLCGNNNLRSIFSLGNLYISNFVSKKDIKKGLKAPLQFKLKGLYLQIFLQIQTALYIRLILIAIH